MGPGCSGDVYLPFGINPVDDRAFEMLPPADEVKDNMDIPNLREHAYAEGLRAGLTARQATIAAYICEGKTNKTIGEQNNIQEKTVKFHLGLIYKKLGVINRLELALKLLKGFKL